MREILFRGKRVDTGEWVEGYYVLGIDGMTCIVTHLDLFAFADGDVNGHHVKKETVGQYTGLQDKNGVKIFEGDVISFGSDGDRGREIKSYQGGFGYEGMGGEEIGFVGHNHFDSIMSRIQVIGTIYDKDGE